MRCTRLRPWLVLVLISLLSAVALTAWAQGKPQPDTANVRYGPYERNVLDLWTAKSDQPTPLVIYIHGGGFRSGDKSGVDARLLGRCLDAGISVAALNYRLSNQAPFPAPMLDSAAQFSSFDRGRANGTSTRRGSPRPGAQPGPASRSGSDTMTTWPTRGAMTLSPRESTRLSCMALVGAQSSYDPRVIKAEIGGRAHEHSALKPFYGLTDSELDSPRAYKLYEEASAINYVSADDPPVFLFYSEPKGPLGADAAPGKGIHHPRFGTLLKEKLDPVGVACVLRHRDDYAGQADPAALMNQELVDFLAKHLHMKVNP